MTNDNSLRYLPALTGLRAWAFILVMLDHWVPGMHEYAMTGNAGVSLFFVLSGFLISRILIEKKQTLTATNAPAPLRSYLTSFYVRRARRIFPIYYLTLFGLLIGGDATVRSQWPWFASYTANTYLINTNTPHLDHLWSLSVEEQLYILLPLVIWWWPTQHLPKLGIVCIAISLLYRLLSFDLFGGTTWWPASYALLPGCLDGYGIGLLTAWYYYYRRQQSSSFFNSPVVLNSLFFAWPALVLGGLLWAISGQGNFYSPGMAVGLRLVVSLYGGYLIGYCHQRLGAVGQLLLLNPISQYLGRISYGLYLFHNLVFNVHSPPHQWARQGWLRLINLIQLEKTYPFLELCFYGLITICIASVSWFLIEKPLLRAATIDTVKVTKVGNLVQKV